MRPRVSLGTGFSLLISQPNKELKGINKISVAISDTLSIVQSLMLYHLFVVFAGLRLIDAWASGTGFETLSTTRKYLNLHESLVSDFKCKLRNSVVTYVILDSAGSNN